MCPHGGDFAVRCPAQEGSSIPLLPGPGLTAPNKWELHQVEQPKEAMFTKRIGYPVFCQTAFSEKV